MQLLAFLNLHRKTVFCVLGACGLAGAGFVAGRYSQPSRQENTLKSETKQRTVTESDARKSEITDANISQSSDTTTTEVTVRKPDGTVVRKRTTHTVSGEEAKTHSVDLAVVQSKSTTETTTQLEQKSITVYKRPEYALEGSLLLKMELKTPTFDNFILQAQKRVLGPAWFGLGFARISGENFGVLTLRFEF